MHLGLIKRLYFTFTLKFVVICPHMFSQLKYCFEFFSTFPAVYFVVIFVVIQKVTFHVFDCGTCVLTNFTFKRFLINTVSVIFYNLCHIYTQQFIVFIFAVTFMTPLPAPYAWCTLTSLKKCTPTLVYQICTTFSFYSPILI